jgi:hypothetical protein
MLSGYRPYLAPEAIHPNAILHSKLEEARHLSIVDQVVFVMCQLFFCRNKISFYLCKHCFLVENPLF